MEAPKYVYRAKIVSVYDGDTMTAIVDLGFKATLEMKLRLLYIDTPELRGDELEEGRRVRDLVREMVLGKDVIIRTEKDRSGKYGRYLAEVFIDDINLNMFLLENGHAKPYI
jgi:micrococcal nuclease